MMSHPLARRAFLLVLTMALATAAAAAPPAITLESPDGTRAELDALTRGKPTMLVFWASWCGYCTREVPAVQKAWDRFARSGLNVVAINPGVRDTAETVRRYVERHRIGYPVYFDADHATLQRFGVQGTPTVILLDGQGREVGRSHGIDERSILALLEG